MAGARGGITDLIVELMERPSEPVLDRIAVVPVEKLRQRKTLVEPERIAKLTGQPTQWIVPRGSVS